MFYVLLSLWQLNAVMLSTIPSCKCLLTLNYFIEVSKQISDNHLFRVYSFLLINPFEGEIVIKAKK